MARKEEIFLLEDQFEVADVDTSAKYIKVSRVVFQARSCAGVTVTVDVNTDIYPIAKGSVYTLVLAQTLEKKGTLTDDRYDHSVYYRNDTFVADFDYIMFGRVYHCNTDVEGVTNAYVYVSFGGLLMRVISPINFVKRIQFNQQLYLMLKKSS
jgi:DNA-directed RNA polymerase I, II, and III subunit RPABC3